MLKTYIIGDIALPLDFTEEDAFREAKSRLSRQRCLPSDATFSLYRRSVDARRREALHFVVSVAVTGSFGSPSEAICKKIGMAEQRVSADEVTIGSQRLSSRLVVVGAGPAGLFAALKLAEMGYSPLLLERGGSVAERVAAYDRFQRERVLDPETNIQFGAGGAGTFSDGKLVTRINDPITGKILSDFVSHGAPREILYLAKPHIGTDVLRGVVQSMCDRLRSLGGEIMYHTRVLSLEKRGNVVTSLHTNQGEISCGAVILAVGNSANDLFLSMLRSGFVVQAKPFSVGMRIEHLQSEIDHALYGAFAGHPALGHAEYQLSHDTKNRGVYSFCMCPGGEVVAAASEAETVVVNGMSYHARDGRNANSALAVSVFPSDFGGTPEGAISLRIGIERSAFCTAGDRYAAPAVMVGDFLDGKLAHEPSRILPTYLGGDVRMVMPQEYLPAFVTDALRGALPHFARRIAPFSSRDAILTGPETRTSSAVRILRDEGRRAVGTENLFPCGEGAGYAGGITSSAADGYRTALAVMSVYSPACG